MRIVHITATDSGGAGKAALRIHQGLKVAGVDSKMLVLRRRSKDRDVILFSAADTVCSETKTSPRKKMLFSQLKQYANIVSPLHEKFSLTVSPYNLGAHPLVRQADIIHLHWISHMLDYHEFFSQIAGRPVVWTLHDMNPFTGGCHYAGDCRRYQKRCGYCPQLGNKKAQDLSRQILKMKESNYKSQKIVAAAASRWLADCAKKSHLMKSFNVQTLHHGIRVDQFKKYRRDISRKRLKLPLNKKIILFGSEYASERKGFSCLLQALSMVRRNPASPPFLLLTFGSQIKSDKPFTGLPFPVRELGYIADDVFLPHVYSSADLLVIPSLEDAFPLICLEGMASGVPIAAFKTGGIPDMITPYETGLLAKTGDVNELARQILFSMDHPQTMRQMAGRARILAENEYSLEAQTKRYCDLYKRCLSNSTQAAKAVRFKGAF